MDWQPIDTVPNTNERVVYGWFGADGPALMDAVASRWHEGDYLTATHWAPFQRPDLDRYRLERAVIAASIRWYSDDDRGALIDPVSALVRHVSSG